jgi:hypothetical protein
MCFLFSNFFWSGLCGAFFPEFTACSFGWWLMLICSERTVLLADAGG